MVAGAAPPLPLLLLLELLEKRSASAEDPSSSIAPAIFDTLHQ